MSSDPRLLQSEGFTEKRSRSRSRGWRMDRRRAIYHSDLLRPMRDTRAHPPELRQFAGDEPEPHLAGAAVEAAPSRDPQVFRRKSPAADITLNTTRAYEMLRASASLAVPLLCLAAKG